MKILAFYLSLQHVSSMYTQGSVFCAICTPDRQTVCLSFLLGVASCYRAAAASALHRHPSYLLRGPASCLPPGLSLLIGCMVGLVTVLSLPTYR